jgi:hypothetical protein
MDKYILTILIICIILGVYFIYTIKKNKSKNAEEVSASEEADNTVSLEENVAKRIINENAPFFDIIDIDNIEEDNMEDYIAEENRNRNPFDVFNDVIKSSATAVAKPIISIEHSDDSDPYGLPTQRIENIKTEEPTIKEHTQAMPRIQEGPEDDNRIAKIINEIKSIYSNEQLEEITKLLIRRTDLNAKTIRRIIDINAAPEKIRKYAQRYN